MYCMFPLLLLLECQYYNYNYNNVCVLKGVPKITTGWLKSRKNGSPGMPIFTECVYFHDTGESLGNARLYCNDPRCMHEKEMLLPTRTAVFHEVAVPISRVAARSDEGQIAVVVQIVRPQSQMSSATIEWQYDLIEKAVIHVNMRTFMQKPTEKPLKVYRIQGHSPLYSSQRCPEL